MKQARSILFMCVFPVVLHAAQSVEDTRQYQQSGSSLLILSGSVDLPTEGIWEVDAKAMAEDFPSLSLVAPRDAYEQLKGRRMAVVEHERTIRRGQYPLYSLIATCREHALNHENTGPATLEELDKEKSVQLIKSMNTSPWPREDKGKEKGPFFYLIPHVRFNFIDDEKRVRPENRELLAFALRPYVNDGKHWVAYTDGQMERVEIDPQLLEKYGQAIRPIHTETSSPEHLPSAFTYTVVASIAETNMPPRLTIPLVNTHAATSMEIDWELKGAAPGDAALLKTLRNAQRGDWRAYLHVSGSPVLHTWLSKSFGAVGRQARRGGENVSAFGVMGGYAAVRETLQMNLLNGRQTGEERVVSIEDVEGVTVKSHPYEEMLGNQDTERVALAERIPHDRFMVYMAKPEAMLPLLDEGADFLSELGGTVTGNNIKYFLKTRYLKRLGADEKWLKAFLLSGGIKECALMAPDLFFIDGTDITVVSRMTNPAVVLPLLKILGVAGLGGQEIVEKTTAAGDAVFWAVRKDLLVVGTSKEEVQLVLDLDTKDGAGSLGKSAEFRYMLTQLPLTDQTRCYAYCSDPFIRRLVGPAVKIGQLRRVEAMNRMKQLTASALLARLDGFGRIQSPETLKTRGYLPESYPTAGYSLDSNLVARSDQYGTLANLQPISRAPVVKVTEAEAQQYGNYVRNYSRFWRQFFDPIALRLDDKQDASLEATVFILPLIDSSIYNGIRQLVMAQEDGAPLMTPRMAPDPVLQFSVNLKEVAWQNVSKTLSDILAGHAPLNPAIVDDFGPSVHLFIHDADPVIALGSGDILGGFGGNAANMGMSGTMMMLPFAASVLTRPCTIAVETGNPEKTIMHLRNAIGTTLSGRMGAGDLRSEIYQIEDRDSWVCLFDIMGMIKLRYGLEVRDGFLMIRNIPWSSKDKVERVEDAALNGMALEVYPAACKRQLPGLHSTATEKSRTSALQSMGHLYPLLSSGYATTMDDALDQHIKLFGFTPRQAENDQWNWVGGELKSTRYGSIHQQKQPAYAEGEEGFGLMGTIEKLKVEMQFEHTGLRTKIRWKTRQD